MSNSRMCINRSTVIQRFDLDIKAAGQPFDDEFEVESNTSRILGVLLTSDREDLLFYRGSQEIKVNNQELCPEGYESKLLMSGLNVAPSERFHQANLPVGNRKIDIRYLDTDHPKAFFQPYRVSLYVFLDEYDYDGEDI